MVLRLGLLGASAIAPAAVIEPARSNPDVVVQAVAARDPARARVYAEAHGIPEALDSYDALVRHPDLDAVYIGLPPSLHEDWAIAAVENGKHVLCEKPFALNWHQAHGMFRNAERAGRVLVEAFHDIHHPLFARVLQLVGPGGQGTLGRLIGLEATLNAHVSQGPGAFRSDPALGGGALLDLGTYCVHWCRLIAGEEPRVAEAAQRLSEQGVDAATHARLVFPSGLQAQVDCDMQAPFHARLHVQGERGTLDIDNPVSPHHGGRLRLTVEGEASEETFTAETTYAFQLAAFVAAVSGAPPRPDPADTLGQMATLDTIREEASRPVLAGSILMPDVRFDPAELTRRTWMFGRVEQAPYACHVRLLADGRIAGHNVEMERRWAVEDGRLVFFDWVDRRSTVFGEARVGAGGRLILLGDIAGSDHRGEHQLTERAPISEMCPFEQGAEFDVRPRRRRNLLIIRAGRGSLHTGWPRDIADEDRNWDLCVSWYGDEAGYREANDGEYRVLQNVGRKYEAIHRLAYVGSPLLEYEAVALFDDDLDTRWSTLNEMFALFREFKLELAQPSLAPGSFVAYDMLRQQPDSILRYTTFVESMAPIFSREALIACAPSMITSSSAFGLDNIWPKLIGEPRNGIAVIDKVGIVHTRPTGSAYSVDRAIAQGNEIQRRYGAPGRVRELGQISIRAT